MTKAYTVRPTPASEAAGQRAAYAALLQGLGKASFEEIKAAMEEREQAPPEAELAPEVIERLRERMKR